MHSRKAKNDRDSAIWSEPVRIRPNRRALGWGVDNYEEPDRDEAG